MDISWKSGEVAGIFDKARGIPEYILTEVFAEVFDRTGFAGKRCNVLDAGCGTGRISFPLAKKFPNLRIRGVDVSGQMLGLLEQKIEKSGIQNYEIEKASLLELNEPPGSYDFSIVSSVLHTITDWKTAVDNIVNATGGYLVLVSETSGMYRLVLNRQKYGEGLMDRFWGEYSRLRKKYSLPGVESTQVGIKWQLGCPEVLEYLKTGGLLESRFELSRRWATEFTVDDLVEIVEKKAYSHMFTVDDVAYGHVVSDLKGWLKKEKIPNLGRVSTNKDIKVEVVKLAVRG